MLQLTLVPLIAELASYRKHEDNVPFSCCNPAVLRPCINTLVHSTHFRYEYHKDLTVYSKGCGDALMKTYKMVLNASGGVIVFLALFEVSTQKCFYISCTYMYTVNTCF